MIKILENLDGSQITTMVITIVVAVALVSSMFIVRGCSIKETELYLQSGCERTYVPGKSEPAWTNCKKPSVNSNE